MRLAILALTMEQSIFELSFVAASILKSLFTLAIWKILSKMTGNYTTVSVVECSLPIFDTVSPLTPVKCAILPPAGSKSTHFT